MKSFNEIIEEEIGKLSSTPPTTILNGETSIKIMHRDLLRQCTANGKKAYFHRWADKETPIMKVNAMLTPKALEILKKKMDSGLIPPSAEISMQKSVVGIIEYEDGTVAEVEPTSIKFEM